MFKYSSSESSDSDDQSENTIDCSYRKLSAESFITYLEQIGIDSKSSGYKAADNVKKLLVMNNCILELPSVTSQFNSLRYLDISNNGLKSLPDFITKFPLYSLVAKNNSLSCQTIPKSFLRWSTTLKIFNLGGNNLDYFPMQLLDIPDLKYLYLGGNRISDIPQTISKISGLSVLCIGGNKLSDLPKTLGMLSNLEVLIVSDNKLETIPHSIAQLSKLKTLQLHKNQLKTLPTEIITLKCLTELSLRDNPLVVKFVNGITHNPASLLEMSARVIKVNQVNYSVYDLPRSLISYLDSAHHCVNPKCNGVYFDSRVEHIKFVDFCGKYKIPLMQYLCSSKCAPNQSRSSLSSIPSSSSSSSSSHSSKMLRKVLLG